MKVLSIDFRQRSGYGDPYPSGISVVMDDSVNIATVTRIVEIATELDPDSGPRDPDYWEPCVTVMAIKKALKGVANISVVKAENTFVETESKWTTDDQKAKLKAEMESCIRKLSSKK